MAKDFFDEEYEKQVQTKEEKSSSYDNWYNHPAPEQAKSNRKPLYIVLMCIALVFCFAFGWLTCYLIDELTTPEEEKILGTVIEYLKNNYYKDVDNWTDAIELSGTMLMQSAGDRFSQLMSPATYYQFNYPTSTVGSSNKVFGVSFLIEDGVGLYVSDVTANSNAYGKLKEGDYVLKLSNMKDQYGNAPTLSGHTFNEIVLSQWASATIQTVLALTDSATFHVLRANDSVADGYEIKTFNLQRGEIPVVDSRYQYQFIEFYFKQRDPFNPYRYIEYTNISTTKLGNANISTYDERHLAELPDGTGYVKIIQFMDYVKTDSLGNMLTDSDGNPVTVSASDEFIEVMQIFKNLGLSRLVLDLKGNPGGSVQYVSEIASMLVTDVKLTAEQKSRVTNRNGELLITYLEMPKPTKVTQKEYLPSTYSTYFGTPTDKTDIVVWTDGNSASASELLTGALRDYGTAVQMGTTTYGKGIAQTWEELPFTGLIQVGDKMIEYPWAIYYTCASYYSPLGINIHGVGYTPDMPYNGLFDYADLWQAVNTYWG